MFKWKWNVFVMVLFFFCCMPYMAVLAEEEAGAVTFPPTGVSQAADETQPTVSKSGGEEAEKQQQPQVLVAGSVPLAVQENIAKEPDAGKAVRSAVTPPKAVEPVVSSEGGIVAENVIAGETSQLASGQELTPAVSAVVSKTASQNEDTGKVIGEIRKVEVSESQDELTQWVWGEVVSVDPVKKQITVKYLDYETYDDAVMVLDINDATVFDNMTGIGDIRPADYVTVDYRKLNNSNVSLLIVVEKKDADADKKEAAVLKNETADVLSTGGLAAGQEKLAEDALVSQEAGMRKDAVLDEAIQTSGLDSLDDITIPLAPPEAQPDIISDEPISTEDINPEHQQQ